MTREELTQLCADEGLRIMGDVFGIILDRGEVTLDDIERFLSEDRDTFTCYENYVVRGINDLSDAIQAEAEETP